MGGPGQAGLHPRIPCAHRVLRRLGDALAFTVAPCNENDKTYFKPLLESVQSLGIRFKAVLADAQYSSQKAREAVRGYDAEPVIPVRRDSRVKEALRVGKDFVVRGAHRLVELFKRRMSVERLFSRAKEWLLLGSLRVRGVEQVVIHAALSLTAMLAVALTAVRSQQPGLMRSIKHFTAWNAASASSIRGRHSSDCGCMRLQFRHAKLDMGENARFLYRLTAERCYIINKNAQSNEFLNRLARVGLRMFKRAINII
jgi:transposase